MTLYVTSAGTSPHCIELSVDEPACAGCLQLSFMAVLQGVTTLHPKLYLKFGNLCVYTFWGRVWAQVFKRDYNPKVVKKLSTGLAPLPLNLQIPA